MTSKTMIPSSSALLVHLISWIFLCLLPSSTTTTAPSKALSFANANLLTLTSAGATASSQSYSRWYNEQGGGKDRYPHRIFLGSKTKNNNPVAVHWKIDHDSDTIQLAVAAEAYGWVGFGLTQAGGMAGSDIVTFTSNNKEMLDSFALRNGKPQVDDNCQDWKLVNYTTSSLVEEGDEEGFNMGDGAIDSEQEEPLIIFEAVRDLVTGDTQDHDITDDSDMATSAHPVIVAWGDEEDVSYHSPDKVAKGYIRFYQPPIVRINDEDGEEGSSVSTDEDMSLEEKSTQGDGEKTARENVSTFDLLAPNFLIPTNETTYEFFCFNLTDLADRGFPNPTNDTKNTSRKEEDVSGFMIQVDFIPDLNSIPYVHHIVLMASPEPNNCQTRRSDIVYIWAPGSHPFIFPDDVGIPIGGGGVGSGSASSTSGGGTSGTVYQSFVLQVHYDNRRHVPNITDNSGVRITYTTSSLKYSAAILSVGDAVIQLKGRDVGKGMTQYDFTCPSSCSEMYIPPEGVTVFAEALHMHESGQRMVNIQTNRDGVELRRGQVDYFDFEQAGAYMVKQPQFQLMPGDGFHTTCYFQEEEGDGKDDSSGRQFGLGSREEMCISYMFYYPAVDTLRGFCGYGLSNWFEGCGSDTYGNVTLSSDDGLGRTFGTKGDDGVCGRIQDSLEAREDAFMDGGGSNRVSSDITSSGRTTRGVSSPGGIMARTLMVMASLFVSVSSIMLTS